MTPSTQPHRLLARRRGGRVYGFAHGQALAAPGLQYRHVYRDVAPGSEPLPIVAKKICRYPPMNTTLTTAPFDYGRAGRHGARHLWRGDCDVVTIGNLSTSHRHALPGDDFNQ